MTVRSSVSTMPAWTATTTIIYLVAGALLSLAPCTIDAAETLPTARFTDPERRAKLDQAFPKIEQAVASWAREHHVPGVAWGIVIDGELATFGGVGYRSTEEKKPVEADSIFRIASMTKSFTALAILKLRDKEMLSLDAPVAKYVPELESLERPTKDSAPITVRHLLTHTAGFPEDNPWGDRQMEISDDELGRWLSDGIPFSTATGSSYEYSNYGYAILGRVVANVSQRPYAQYINEEILHPLGMKSTFWDAKDAPESRLAAGYRWQDAKHQIEVPLGHGAFGPMGGIFTSSEDIARWVALMLSAYPPRNDPETPPALRYSLREMQQGAGYPRLYVRRRSPASPIDGLASTYGFGLGSYQACDLGWSVSHSGGFPGFGSNMRWLPEQGVGAFAMANLTYAPAGGLVGQIFQILKASGGLQRRQQPVSPVLRSAIERITDLINDWSDEKATAIAADNLFLDESLDRRKTHIRALRDGLGVCRVVETDAQNALRGQFRMACDDGWLNVVLTLAPTQPPRVQHLAVTGGRPPTPLMQRAIDAVLNGIIRDPQLDLSPPADPAAIGALLQTARENYGTCRRGALLEGDGSTRTRLRLECDRGAVEMTVVLADGKLETLRFRPPPDAPCVP